MAKVSQEGAEVNARIVYWGIEGAGKRTSLAGVYRKLRPDHRGEMRDVPTRFDPSVSYTVLPIELGDVSGMRTRIELVAVPGGPEHAPTRKQLLDQVDGIVLVVDCQRERIEENLTSLEELAKALEDYARSIDRSRSSCSTTSATSPTATPPRSCIADSGSRGATVFEAVATQGTGLLQALSTISKKVIRTLREESIGAGRTPLAPPEPAVAESSRSPTEPAPAAPLRSTPTQAMEEAILREGDHPEGAAIERESNAAAALMQDEPWLHEPESLEAPAARLGASLAIVSVGQATRADERSVRIPLVLGDDEGGTSTVVLTLRIDPLVGESGD